jgi:hypothetical protein
MQIVQVAFPTCAFSNSFVYFVSFLSFGPKFVTNQVILSWGVCGPPKVVVAPKAR